MSTTIRQKLVDAVVARMRTILTSNGYETNVGQTVDDWRTHFDETELPALGVYDLTALSQKAHREAGRTQHELPVQIRIFVAGDTRKTDLRKMLGDVMKAVGTDLRWKVDGAALAMDTKPKQDGFIISENSFEVAGGAVEFVIEYISNTFDPYA